MMIPLGDTTAILPRVQGIGVKHTGISLTILQTQQLSAVCVASPLHVHKTQSPVLRALHSRSQRRTSSVSSLCSVRKFQREHDLSRQRSQEELRIVCEPADSGLCIQKKQLLAPQQTQDIFLRTITSDEETSSSLEMKEEQSTGKSFIKFLDFY
jgi:hypothetical protein